MANVKGSAITSRVLWVRLNHGEEGLRRLKEGLSLATRAVVEGPLVKAQWYPFDVFIDLNQTIDSVFAKGDLATVRALGRFGADANLTTIYRLFYAVGTVKWIIDRGARLWDLHYDSGKMVVIRRPGNEVDFRIVNFATPHRAHCLSVIGWAERSVELSGGKEVKAVEQSCRAKGDAECAVHIEWR